MASRKNEAVFERLPGFKKPLRQGWLPGKSFESASLFWIPVAKTPVEGFEKARGSFGTPLGRTSGCSLKLPGLDTQRTAVPYRFGIVGRREAKGRLALAVS